MTPTKKLIEVDIPLNAINAASAREKSIRHGHPSTLHLWWARRPLAAARAVIFAQMVDDPSSYPDVFPTPEAQERERDRLFGLIKELVVWENTTNEEVLAQARDEIWKSWRRTCAENRDHPRAAKLFNPERLPAFHDPFAGGGALPLEAQRLGLESWASDLNPVAVLINKAMIEIPTRFAGRPPVNPEVRADPRLFGREWRGAQGLAEDVRHYGKWMRDEAERRIGNLYPKVDITPEMVTDRPDLKPYEGKRLTVIAWLWARTVKSPNPAFADVDVPLVSTFMLSTKPGKEAYVEPVVENGGYRFTVKVGKPKDVEAASRGTTLGKRNAFRCLMSETPIPYGYIRDEGKAGRMGARLMAVVAEGDRGRVYLPPIPEHESAARQATPEWKPEMALPENPRDFKTPNYGLNTFGDLFTPRQLVALTTFSDLVGEAMERIRRDAADAGLSDPATDDPRCEKPLREGGSGALAYAEAIRVYLAFLVSQVSNHSSSICGWNSPNAQMRSVFARQAIPMVWDYAESNVFSASSGSFNNIFERQVKAFEVLGYGKDSVVSQLDVNQQSITVEKLVSTDPPYYDNIGYADLSDFFYVWLRRSLHSVYPDLFATIGTPKEAELVATPYRHGSKTKAEAFFLDGMTRAMRRIVEQAHPAFPVTIYYAFKQSEETDGAGTSSTGWETFLDAVIRAGFTVTGTWPIRTEKKGRVIGNDMNALDSSIVLVCRRRPGDAPAATKGEFLAALARELPVALRLLQEGDVAPVDLAQAAIGPGMAIYTRYSRVLDSGGSSVTVREALAAINRVLDEALAEQEGDFDADTRWALAWFEQSGFDEGDYGTAETLSKAKNTSVQGLVDAGILESRQGHVRLLRPAELPEGWDPAADSRRSAWESVHHLVRALESGGECAAADLAAKMGSDAETARDLAYRLYSLCERKKRAAEALSYNALVQSWREVAVLARTARAVAERPDPQGRILFESEE